MIRAALCAALLTVGACAPTISAHPTGGLIGGQVTQGLIDSAWNLDQAIGIGVLPASDPAAACLHATIATMGLDATVPTATFRPRVTDLISAGSVAYILARQAQVPVVVSPGCKALIGQIVLDAGQMGARSLPSFLTGIAPRVQ